MNGIYAALIAAVLVGLNAWLYIANKKTPVPEGCENLRPDCSACGIKECSLRAGFIKEENTDGNR